MSLLLSLTIALFASQALALPQELAKPQPGPGKPCANDPALAGFTDLGGISSFCLNARRPTITLTSVVTSTATAAINTTTTVVVTTSQYKSTSIKYFTPTPTSASCASSAAAFAAPAGAGADSGNFITASSLPATTAAPLVARDQPCKPCPGRPNLADQVVSACYCFFPQQNTQTAEITKATTITTTIRNTITTTSTKTVTIPKVRTRTLAVGCEPTNVNLYGSITYAACGSPGLGVLDYAECDYPHPAGEFDRADCCSACAQTLNCFQGLSDAASGSCRLSVRTGNIQYNATVFTPDCPMGQSVAVFGDQFPPTQGSGFVRGHCAQSC